MTTTLPVIPQLLALERFRVVVSPSSNDET
jgi:hypothetical protein